MTVEERSVWAMLVVIPTAMTVYFSVVLSRAASMPIEEVSWVVPLLWTIGATILGIIAGVIVITIGMAIRAEITGEGKEDIEDDRSDVRDKEIERYGEARAQHFTSIGATAAIVLAMCGAHQFWIASALLLAGALGGFYGGIIRILAYRRGF
ncbi:MAG: hypothetical protein JW722_07235 [Demequinaceae bacterium]|nr:hypothetical protein [Demequinaceae bacterium]